MERFTGGSSNLYDGQSKEDKLINTTKDIFKKEEVNKETEPKITNSYILSNDLTKVLKKNRELYSYIEILQSDVKKLEDKIKKFETAL